MLEKVNKINIVPFEIAWVAISIVKALNMSGEDTILQIVLICGILIGILGALGSGYSYKEMILLIISVGLSIIVAAHSGKLTIFFSILVLFASKGCNYRKMVKIEFWIRAIGMACIVFLALSGKIPMGYDMDFINGAPRPRYGLGLGHSNVAHLLLFLTVCMFIYSYYEKLNIAYCILILIINHYFKSYTGTRTGYYLIIGVVICSYLMKRGIRIKFVRKPLLIFMEYSCIIFAATSYILSVLYPKNAFVVVLNSIVSSRFAGGSWVLSIYPFSLFGNDVDSLSFPVDNGYMYMYAEYGIITLLTFIILHTILMKKLIKNQRWLEILILFFVLLYGMTENFIPNIVMNFSLLFLSLLFNKTEYATIGYLKRKYDIQRWEPTETVYKKQV